MSVCILIKLQEFIWSISYISSRNVLRICNQAIIRVQLYCNDRTCAFYSVEHAPGTYFRWSRKEHYQYKYKNKISLISISYKWSVLQYKYKSTFFSQNDLKQVFYGLRSSQHRLFFMSVIDSKWESHVPGLRVFDMDIMRLSFWKSLVMTNCVTEFDFGFCSGFYCRIKTDHGQPRKLFLKSYYGMYILIL